MHITLFLFDGVTALDAVGVYDPLTRLPQRTIVMATISGDPVAAGEGSLRLGGGVALREVATTDVLIVPGGSAEGIRTCIGDAVLRRELVRLDAESGMTASVCTGALILGAAGLLRGRRAATHWRAAGHLSVFGADASGERVTVDGKYWTAAGVSAGIDLGLRLAGHLAGDDIGQAIELSMEYAPVPPYGTGDPRTASPALRSIVEERLSS